MHSRWGFQHASGFCGICIAYKSHGYVHWRHIMHDGGNGLQCMHVTWAVSLLSLPHPLVGRKVRLRYALPESCTGISSSIGLVPSASKLQLGPEAIKNVPCLNPKTVVLSLDKVQSIDHPILECVPLSFFAGTAKTLQPGTVAPNTSLSSNSCNHEHDSVQATDGKDCFGHRINSRHWPGNS